MRLESTNMTTVCYLDLKFAKDVDQCERSMAKEIERMRRDEEKLNESTALQIAIEERKAYALRAQAKRDREAKDEETARQSVQDDIENDFKLSKACEGDEEYALRVRKEIEDELYAAELEELEREEYDQRVSMQRAILEQDMMLAQSEQEKMTRELEEEYEALRQRDFDMACEIQSNLTTHNIAEDERQVLEDQRLAKKLITKSARQVHEDVKRASMLGTANLDSTSAIAAQWEGATADIQNVSGGLCITLLLPHLKDLKVIMKKNHIVDIEAKRMILSGDKAATKQNSIYSAEFEIKGRRLNLTERDMNYNYCSETGLLHIYVDNIHLDDEEANSKEEKADGPMRSYRGAVLAGIRQSFSRVFNK